MNFVYPPPHPVTKLRKISIKYILSFFPEKHIFMADPGQPLPFEGLTPLQRDNLRQERDVDIQECHAIVQFFSQM